MLMLKEDNDAILKSNKVMMIEMLTQTLVYLIRRLLHYDLVVSYSNSVDNDECPNRHHHFDHPHYDHA